MGKRTVRPLAVAIASAAAVAGLLAAGGPASAATQAPGAPRSAAVSAVRTADDHTDIRRQWVLDQLRWADEHGYLHPAPESQGPSGR
ncbi:hypothetical protein ACIRU5_17295 [Streptomyces misionensis]|uniref:hypothetical protein n=1 Tax=Streptomyces misionensis TaxID=67331 RepID=UPI00380314D1